MIVEPENNSDVTYNPTEMNRIIDMGRKASRDELQNWFDNALVQFCEMLNKAPLDTALVQTSIVNFTSYLGFNRVKINYKLIKLDWYFSWTVFDSVLSSMYRLKQIPTADILAWKRSMLDACTQLCPPELKKDSRRNIVSEIKNLGGFV